MGLALFQPTTNNIDVLPNKLFEYMAGAIPIVASDFPLMRQVVCKHKCGLTVYPTSPKQIAEAVDYLVLHPSEARELGINGRSIVQERYSWASSQYALLRAYSALGMSNLNVVVKASSKKM